MQLHRHPELLDRLAAAYALGSLRGPARRRFEALAREQPAIRAAALLWQGRLTAFTELQPAVAPPDSLWPGIAALLRADRERQGLRAARAQPAAAAGAAPRWWQALALWRGASAAGALAAALALLLLLEQRDERLALDQQLRTLQAQLLATPEVAYVSVLQDERSGAALLVTFDARSQQLRLQRVGAYAEAEDKSLQLWALPPGAAPRSLGVLSRQQLLDLAASEGAVRGVPLLAVSLEPRGGVPSERGPTGPVLFKGELIRKLG